MKKIVTDLGNRWEHPHMSKWQLGLGNLVIYIAEWPWDLWYYVRDFRKR